MTLNTVYGNPTFGGYLSIGGGKTLTLTGVISGVGTLQLDDGNGTLVVSGTNTYQGGTLIWSGPLSVGADANLGDGLGRPDVAHRRYVGDDGDASARPGRSRSPAAPSARARRRR